MLLKTIYFIYYALYITFICFNYFKIYFSKYFEIKINTNKVEIK